MSTTGNALFRRTIRPCSETLPAQKARLQVPMKRSTGSMQPLPACASRAITQTWARRNSPGDSCTMFSRQGTHPSRLLQRRCWRRYASNPVRFTSPSQTASGRFFQVNAPISVARRAPLAGSGIPAKWGFAAGLKSFLAFFRISC